MKPGPYQLVSIDLVSPLAKTGADRKVAAIATGVNSCLSIEHLNRANTNIARNNRACQAKTALLVRSFAVSKLIAITEFHEDYFKKTAFTALLSVLIFFLIAPAYI